MVEAKTTSVAPGIYDTPPLSISLRKKQLGQILRNQMFQTYSRDMCLSLLPRGETQTLEDLASWVVVRWIEASSHATLNTEEAQRFRVMIDEPILNFRLFQLFTVGNKMIAPYKVPHTTTKKVGVLGKRIVREVTTLSLPDRHTWSDEFVSADLKAFNYYLELLTQQGSDIGNILSQCQIRFERGGVDKAAEYLKSGHFVAIRALPSPDRLYSDIKPNTFGMMVPLVLYEGRVFADSNDRLLNMRFRLRDKTNGYVFGTTKSTTDMPESYSSALLVYRNPYIAN